MQWLEHYPPPMSLGFANHFLHSSNGVESAATPCLTSLHCRFLVWALYTSQLCMTSGLTRLASRSDSVVFPHCAQELPITGRWNFIGFWIWNFLQRLTDLNTVPRDSVMKGLRRWRLTRGSQSLGMGLEVWHSGLTSCLLLASWLQVQ